MHTKECYISCRTGKELEEWYFMLDGATSYRKRDYATESYFRDVFSQAKFSGETPVVDATWFNIVAHRIFYQIHNDPGFTHLIRKKITNKLDKIKKPTPLKSLKLNTLSIGPEFPYFSNIKITSFDPSGNIVSMPIIAVSYHPGWGRQYLL